jgi:hypothetical protein
MAVTPKRARTLALSLENVSQYPHFDRIAFRTPRRTFATLALNGADLNFAFDLLLQKHFCELAPHAIAPVAGGWGRMGFTRCDLALIDAATFRAALKAAHARASAPLPKKKTAKAANKTPTVSQRKAAPTARAAAPVRKRGPRSR